MAHPLKGRTLPEDHSRKVAKAKTAERILAAARKLFARDGHKGATIRDIAAEAGMSTGAIFANYKNKSELYRAAHGHDPITPEQGVSLLRAIEGMVTYGVFQQGQEGSYDPYFQEELDKLQAAVTAIRPIKANFD